MRRSAFHALLAAMLALAACSVPSTGPLRYALNNQAGDAAHARFDVIPISRRVVDTLLAQPQPAFHSRFKKYSPPPELPIAIGDMLGVTIWESSAEGLFGRSLDADLLSGAELAKRLRAAGVPMPAGKLSATEQTRTLARLKTTAGGQALLQSMQPAGRVGTRMPDQQVGIDGAISVPYAGRIRVAGRTPAQVQELIQRMLAGKALDPQALVLVEHSDLNSVTVTGDLIAGARVPLMPGGTRLLDAIAKAGGVRGPVRDAYVELSRGGITATIPLEKLIADPDENIFARPGDVLTVASKPGVISVFGATGQNTALILNADRVTLNEALAQAGGLNDSLADPQAVFLLRYEPASLVEALGARVIPGNLPGLTPVAYRLNLADMSSYGLARRFVVQDRDIIYVSDAVVTPIEKVLNVFALLTQPTVNAYFLCQSGQVKC